MDKQSTPLDWVNERAKCTLGHVFKCLEAEVDEDVKIRNKQLTKEEREIRSIGFLFEVDQRTGESFLVTRNGVRVMASIQFRLEPNSIIVKQGGRQILEASLTMNDEGRCLLRVDGTELENWQFRRRALEDLFFGF